MQGGILKKKIIEYWVVNIILNGFGMTVRIKDRVIFNDLMCLV